MKPEIIENYGNRVRVRTCGLCWQGDKLLMVNHKNLTSGNFWAPPGGGTEFGESTADVLTREFKEETNLTIMAGTFQFACEFIQHPLHAIELFFNVFPIAGEPIKGSDPESSPAQQIITNVMHLTLDEILSLPVHERHGVFRFVKNAAELKNLSGFYRI